MTRWRTDLGYNRAPLGTADDVFDADGQAILNFTQAMAAARQHVSRVRANHAEAKALKAAGPPITVRTVVEAYLTKRDAREAAQKNGIGLKKDARSRLTKHVFADESLYAASFLNLTKESLRTWLERLPAAMAPSTTRRLANDLKAALNDGLIAYRLRVPAHLAATIRHGLKLPENHTPVARDMQILSDGEIRKIIAAASKIDRAGGWDGDLTRMVRCWPPREHGSPRLPGSRPRIFRSPNGACWCRSRAKVAAARFRLEQLSRSEQTSWKPSAPS